MLKCYSIFLIAILSLFIYSNVHAMENDPDGFRGVKWETKISDLNNNEFKFGINKEIILFYTYVTDELKILSPELYKINYIFWHDKLWGVMITGKGQVNFEKLLRVLQEKFGKETQADLSFPKYIWLGQKTCIIFDYDSLKNEFKCSFTSIKITKEMENWEKDQAKKGAQNDL